MDDKLAILRTKKTGLFMHKARENMGRSIDDCALWLNINQEDYLAMEEGEQSPSLPQLESLAFFLKTSFDFLHEGPKGEDQNRESFSREINLNLLALRDRIIATLLKQHCQANGQSLDELAELTTIPVDTLENYEKGSVPIPLIDLEELVAKLNLTMDTFFSIRGPLGHASGQVNATERENELPVELQEFISKPVNLPYLELAMRLSQMDADKLRSIAASLLEITY